VRASTLRRVVRRGDDVRQVEKRLIDAELSVAHLRAILFRQRDTGVRRGRPSLQNRTPNRRKSLEAIQEEAMTWQRRRRLGRQQPGKRGKRCRADRGRRQALNCAERLAVRELRRRVLLPQPELCRKRWGQSDLVGVSNSSAITDSIFTSPRREPPAAL
jgi:hypothetical protein